MKFKFLFAVLLWFGISFCSSNAYILCSLFDNPCADDPTLSPENAALAKSCLVGKNAENCQKIAWKYYKGEDINKNEAFAIYYARKLRNIDSSYDFTLAYMLGFSNNKKLRDYKTAISIFQSRCDERKDGASCTNAGSIFNNSLKDYKKAFSYYVKACDLNDDVGCYNLADYYNDGIAVERNKNKAKELYKKACSLGEEAACKK